ncbi:hypothetical protein JXA85_04060 [Candidatus Woesearchaeota archaeon]|nr:hypothetical protein [Candidatus Woesearchaeota archaeon]
MGIGHPARKGIFFAIMSIIVVAIITALIAIPATHTLKTKTYDTARRIRSMNDFMQDINQDMRRALYITGFRTILGLEQFIIENGTYVDNSRIRFSEMLLNGTYNGSCIVIMQNATFTNWTTKIKEKAEEMGIDVEFKVNDATIYHLTPWTLQMLANISVNLSDKKKTASWYQEKLITADMNIELFEDPTYIINSYGRVSAIFTKSDFPYLVNETNNDTTNLLSFINRSLYIESTAGPSFLMRLEGNLSASDYGVESLVNLAKFSAQDVPIYESSAVDWVYFSNYSHTPLSIMNVTTKTGYSWFRLDSGSLSNYDCGGLVI